MKQVILASFILLTTFIHAQVEKNVGDFKELKVYDLIEVELIKSDKNQVVISGENTGDVVIVNKNEVLKIKMNLPKIFDGNETTVKLYYTNVDIIDANEGAFVSSSDPISQFEIDVRAQEGGHIKVIVEDMTFVEAKAVTGGKIQLSGTTKSQNIKLTTGGIYESDELISEMAKVNIKAAGEAHISATEEIDVKVKAGGTVYIHGTTKKLVEKIALGGKIIYKD